MKIPLYTEEARRTNDSNSGLWYNKFCDQWHNWSLKSYTTNQAGKTVTINPKLNWIDRVSSNKLGDLSLIKETVKRQEKMVAARGGKVFHRSTSTPFVTGLGNPHPIENGFCWHHLLGTPFLPASSVKGLVRDWAKNWCHTKDPDIPRFFGEQNGKDNTGSIIFLDAIPTTEVKLKAEIMTPHYGDYYASDTSNGITPPGDWLSPNPIPFLAVDIGQEFQFAVISRNPAANSELAKVVEWMQEALTTLGAGAKTAVGYGIFSESAERRRARETQEEQQEKKLQQEARRAEISSDADNKNYTGIARKIFIEADSDNWQGDNGKLYSGAEHWLPKIKNEDDQVIRGQAVDFLAELLDSGKNSGIMSDPEKKKGKKANKYYYEKPRARAIAKELMEYKKNSTGKETGINDSN